MRFPLTQLNSSLFVTKMTSHGDKMLERFNNSDFSQLLLYYYDNED